MRVSAAALILLAPVVDWLGELAVLMSVEAACVDVVFDVPLFVLSDQTLNEHFVALTESLATNIVRIVTSQKLLASDQISISDDCVVFLSRVAFVAVVKSSTLIAKGVIFADAVDVVSWQTTFSEEWVLSVGNAPTSVAEKVVHWWRDTFDILEHKIHHFLELDKPALARAAHTSDVFSIDAGDIKEPFWVTFTFKFRHLEHIVHFGVAAVAMMV